MGLVKYKEKRNFKKTPEPEGNVEKTGKHRFVVQEHHARRLHYDFRMETGGVLKSWAVPKGPSMNPKDKRLAVMTEDHPVKYLTFEGTIPEGSYGAGEMSIWDTGTYELDDEYGSFVAAEKEGKIKFNIHGKKLKGAFQLVKMKGTEDNQWLLMKVKDEFAEEKSGAAESNGSDKPPSKKKPKTEGRGEELENVIAPMLAKVGDEPFDDDDWIFEAKLDGYRAIAEVKDGNVRLYSRTGKSYENDYPGIYHSLQNLQFDAVLDGEIVVLNENGVPVFNLLQNYKSDKSHPLFYYVFDLLSFDGEDFTRKSLIKRKEQLRKILLNLPGISFSEHVAGKGKDFFNMMKKEGLEGMIAKKADSLYLPGVRTSDWLKIKVQDTADVIVGGFTEAKDSREIGALLLGMYGEDDRLHFVGHCGTGFDRQKIRELYEIFTPLEQRKNPFAERPKPNAKVTWIRPEIVCEVAFSEWTKAGILRHPSFQRLRDDKKPEDIRLENEREVKAPPKKKSTSKKNLKKEETDISEVSSKGDSTLKVGKYEVRLTHLDKVYFPKKGYTKFDLLNYYIQVADYILPYLKNRPQSLHRFPDGVEGNSFFQKDINFKVPEFAETASFYSESTGKDIEWIVCNNLATLLFIVNMGTIEINPWNSTVDNPERPDYAAIDLDPGDKTSFQQVVETALVAKEVLDAADIPAYCKTSGSRGLHIFIPMGGKYNYDQARDFVKAIMLLVHQRLPKITSLKRSPSQRRSQIYLDYLQNKQGQTLVAPYSVRPRDYATVSTPLRWDEVNETLNVQDYTIETMPDRLKEAGDLFKPVIGKGLDMEKALEKLMES